MRRVAPAVCALLAVSAGPALARPLRAAPAACVTFTDGAGNERWSDGANWSTNAPPAAGDDACVPDGFPIVFVDAPAQVRSLAAPNAALFVTADLSVGAGGADVSALDIGAGRVTLAGPLTAATVNLHGGSLGGAGAETVGVLRWSSGTLAGAAAVSGDAFLSGGLAGAGGLRIAPGATAHVARDTTLAVPLANDGAVSLSGGVLTLTGGGSGSGTYAVAAGAALDWHRGSYALAAPAVTGPGAVTVSGADVTAAGAAGLGDVAVTGGALRATGALTTGRLSLAGGTLDLSHGGTLRAAAYAQAPGGTLSRAIDGAPLAVSGPAALDGTLAVERRDLVPGDGASFPVISYGSLTGSWATVAVAPVDGMSFRLVYGPDGAALAAHRNPLPVPEPTVTPGPPPPPPPEPPKPGVRSVAVPDRGTVLVQPPPESPGATPAFVPLQHAASLPDGSVVDARKGRITVTAASSFTDAKRPPTTVTVAAGIFRIRQVRATDGRTAVTELILRTPPGAGRACLPPHKGIPRTLSRVRPPVSHRTIRRLTATAKGVVRAFGSVAVLSTRNSTFELRDRCDGTWARVAKGRASLFDRIHGRTARLRAGRSRIVRARLFAARSLHLKKVPRPRP